MNAALQNYFNNLCCDGQCHCPDGYTKDATSGLCVKQETMAPVIDQIGYCLAPSRHNEYSKLGSILYKYPFNIAAFSVPFGTANANIIAYLDTYDQWKNTPTYHNIGPMNRASVWIDSNCDGQPNGLLGGAKTTIAYTYNNTGAARIVYIGVGSDNASKLTFNETVLYDNNTLGDQFEIWKLIPVMLRPGLNYFNIIGTGDGTDTDAVAMTIYDNTAAQLTAATSDNDLTILFTTANLRNTSYDVANCADGWSLDTSGGLGNYVCRRTVTTNCTPS